MRILKLWSERFRSAVSAWKARRSTSPNRHNSLKQCRYSYWLCGATAKANVYGSKNVLGNFLKNILQEEVEIGEHLATPKSLAMMTEELVKN